MRTRCRLWGVSMKFDWVFCWGRHTLADEGAGCDDGEADPEAVDDTAE